jgi:hypothetical protein
MMWEFRRMTTLAQMQTRSGKVHGPMLPLWFKQITELIGKIRDALGPMDLINGHEWTPIPRCRSLMIQVEEMMKLSREDEFWAETLPEFLELIGNELLVINEFWTPKLMNELIHIALEFRR